MPGVGVAYRDGAHSDGAFGRGIRTGDIATGHIATGPFGRGISRRGIDALRPVIKAIGNRGRSGLIDKAQHIQSGELRCVLGRLTLGIIKIGGHRDHHTVNIVIKSVFGAEAQRCQYLGAHLYGRFVARDGADLY